MSAQLRLVCVEKNFLFLCSKIISLKNKQKTELTDIFSEFRTDGIQNYGRFGSVFRIPIPNRPTVFRTPLI